MPGDVPALRVENERLRAENARLREAGERLRMLLEDKDAKIADMEERIARLERLISRNSGNSSMPPSTDDLPGKKPPERRTRQGGMKRKPGKQPGAPGSYLAWNEQPDETIPRFPRGACPCGADLEDARDLGVKYSHQVTDLPEARAETIQYDRHEVECGCGRRHVAGGGRGAGHGDLRAELPGLVRVLDGDAPRPGRALRGHPGVDDRDPPQRRVGARPAGPRRPGGGRGEHDDPGADHLGPGGLRRRDTDPVRPRPQGEEEVPARRVHNLLTYYFLADRDLPSFKAFVYSDLHGTVLVHDRYQNYDKFGGVAHQLCTAHILRDLEDAAQAYPDAIWPGQAADALRALIHQANLARDQGLHAVPANRTAKDLKLFRHGVNVGLAQLPRVPGANEKQPPGRLLLECLKHREADVLRFLSDTGASDRLCK
jgi:hypothetical protein